MLHPDAELRYIDPYIGYGLFARKPIPRGTITWVLDKVDQRLTPEQVYDLQPILRQSVLKYGYIDRAGNSVVCWDHARFQNHSCDPNTLSSGLDLDVAVRDIAQDEQITYEYALINMSLDCLCGYVNCRGRIGPNDFDGHADRWDALTADAFTRAGVVDQPLCELFTAEVEEAVAGRIPISSCRVRRLQRPHAASVPAKGSSAAATEG